MIPVRRRLLFAAVTTLGVLGAAELVPRLLFGPPPPAETIARVGPCTVEGARLECPMEPNLAVVAPPHSTRPRVVVLGGSTVRMLPPSEANFPTRMQQRAPELEILNLGLPGYSTAGVWNILRQLEAFAPDLVVVMTGHNDYNTAVFDGSIRAVSLWTLPFEQALSSSWIRAWVRPTRPRREANPSSRVLPIEDDYALRVADQVDARFRTELVALVRASPAPVVLTTLLRNFDRPPTGVIVTGRPRCAAALNGDWTVEHAPQALPVVTAACPDTSISAWVGAHVEVDPARKAELWRASLRLDAAPLRAPLSADDTIREVAAAEGVPLVDLAQSAAYPPGQWFFDSLHTNADGADAIAAAVVPVVRQVLARTR